MYTECSILFTLLAHSLIWPLKNMSDMMFDWIMFYATALIRTGFMWNSLENLQGFLWNYLQSLAVCEKETAYMAIQKKLHSLVRLSQNLRGFMWKYLESLRFVQNETAYLTIKKNCTVVFITEPHYFCAHIMNIFLAISFCQWPSL